MKNHAESGYLYGRGNGIKKTGCFTTTRRVKVLYQNIFVIPPLHRYHQGRRSRFVPHCHGRKCQVICSVSAQRCGRMCKG